MDVFASERINGELGIMPSKKTTKKNKTFGVNTTVYWRVKAVRPLKDYKLYVRFKDGLAGYVNMNKMFTSKEDIGVFEPLRNKELFNKVFVKDEVVTWEGDLDLAPDAMYDEIKKNGTWVLD